MIRLSKKQAEDLAKGNARIRETRKLKIPKKKNDKKKKAVPNYTVFAISMSQIGIPEPVREYIFHKKRQWRSDFVWPGYGLAVEIEGGSWINGGHNRGKGFNKDIEKYNSLTMYGFQLLRFTPQQVESGHALLLIEEWFKENGRQEPICE